MTTKDGQATLVCVEEREVDVTPRPSLLGGREGPGPLPGDSKAGKQASPFLASLFQVLLLLAARDVISFHQDEFLETGLCPQCSGHP